MPHKITKKIGDHFKALVAVGSCFGFSYTTSNSILLENPLFHCNAAFGQESSSSGKHRM